MAKKGANTKVEAANTRKASSKAEKEQQKRAEMEAKEAAKWAKGAKKNDKKEAEAEKKVALLRKKQEAQRLLAQEEKQLNKPKACKPKYTPKKSLFTTERTVAPTSMLDEEPTSGKTKPILTEKDIEKHPERRFKNALKVFEEREIKNFRAQYPGLRLSQLKEIMYKEFQRSPDNPFNQSNVVSYNVTLEEANRKIHGELESQEEEDQEDDQEKESFISAPASDNVMVSEKAVTCY